MRREWRGLARLALSPRGTRQLCRQPHRCQAVKGVDFSRGALWIAKLGEGRRTPRRRATVYAEPPRRGRGRSRVRRCPSGPCYSSPHILTTRHSTFFATGDAWGQAPRAIQELAGHRDFSTTLRYMHLSPQAKDSAVRLLETPGWLGDYLETGIPADLETGTERSR